MSKKMNREASSHHKHTRAAQVFSMLSQSYQSFRHSENQTLLQVK